MTREKFWEIVQILVQKDYWDAQSVPSKEVEEILTKSILIPKPKFKVGDKVELKGSNTYPEFIVVDYSYSPEQKTWKYEGISSSNKSVEDALELVKAK